jgi:hypothetical protein
VQVTVKFSSSPGGCCGYPRVFQVAGPRSGFRASPQVAESSSHVFGAMKSRGVPAPADSTKEEEVRGKGGSYTVGSPVAGRTYGFGADTAVSIEREVVSGHAYAVLTPETRSPGWCGNDNPTFLSADGVLVP